MNINIEIKTKQFPAVHMLKHDAPDWADVNVPPVREQRDGMSEAWAIALVLIASSIPAAVIAGWLLDKFKDNKTTTITINRKQVDLDKGEIIRIIEETQTMQK